MGSCRAREETGVADRVTFFVSDASTLRRSGGYDLVTIFEALHDMSRPVEALRAIRRILSKRGFVVVADELVEPEFTHRHRPRIGTRTDGASCRVCPARWMIRTLQQLGR
jgi:ubiquinone/menaquinone biosynthesis C-methylase UbiE